MSEFLFFRSYESLEEAIAVQNILNKNNIPNVMSEERALLDSNMIGQQFDLPYRVKILSEHFIIAEDILRQSLDINAVEVEADYYLLGFSNEELIEIIEKKDEWGTYDYALALKLLEERGITFTPADLELFHKKRMAALSVPEDGVNIWTVIGYCSAAIGGLLGTFIGFVMMRARKTLPDGSRVYIYNNNSRRHGKYIAILGVVAMVLWTAYSVMFDKMPPSLGSIFGILTTVHQL